MSDQITEVPYVDTCVFCKVAKGLVRAEVVYQDDQVVAFRDIHPQAPVHVLIIPRRHVTGLWETDENDVQLLGHALLTANKVAEIEGVGDSGFRVVANSGPDAGQSVDHLHYHVLGGRRLDWPPG